MQVNIRPMLLLRVLDICQCVAREPRFFAHAYDNTRDLRFRRTYYKSLKLHRKYKACFIMFIIPVVYI